MFNHNKNNRFGKKLEDGLAAHKADHQAWSRRQFLGNTGLMAAGGTLLGGSSLFSWAAPLISSLYDNPDNDRVLVLIRLFGGNDGLNTIVPFGDNARRSRYESLRSTLAIPKLNLNQLQFADDTYSQFGLPHEMGTDNDDTGIYKMWQEGNMAVIHNVGYPDQSTSHFKSSDIWASGAINNVGQNASVNDERRDSGWLGRYFSDQLPTFLGAPPVIPPAIQIGSANNLIFKGLESNPFDLVFTDPKSFYKLVDRGELYNTSSSDFSSTCIADIERRFIRQKTNDAFRYADSVETAWNAPGNQDIPHDENNTLAKELAIVGKLIKGGLGTKIYQVSLGGFDTHRVQHLNHPALLQKLSTAIRGTFEGLGEHADRVMMMTFSEFGRQVTENISAGTDHGTLAPIMLFGNKVNGRNMYGTPIDLSPGKINGGMVDFDTQDGAIDFRSVYDKVLRDWLCADAQTSDTVLNPTEDAIAQNVPEYTACSPQGNIHCQDPLGGMISGGCNSTVAESSTLEGYIASQVVFGYNIVKDNDNSTHIELKYATKITGNIRLEIKYNYTDPVTEMTEERELLMKEGYLEKGNYLHRFDATEMLADGILNNTDRYIARFSINGVSIDRNFKIN